MALRRRQRLLAALPKPKRSKAEVVDVDCSSMQSIEIKQAESVVVDEDKADTIDSSNSVDFLGTQNLDHISANSEGDRYIVNE
jgi:hypothetical protein